MMMKVVFVYPGISAIGFNSFGNPVLGYESSMIHHGLCSLSACLKREGFDTQLIDMRALTGWDDFVLTLRKLKPDAVGITSLSVEYDIVRRCLALTKDVAHSITSLVGGVHATVSLDDVAADPNVDHIITGEAEISAVELLRALGAGIACQRVTVGERPADLDELPFVDRELFDYGGELSHPFLADVFGFEPPFVTILTSRGCLYNCSFCQPTERLMFGREVRRRSVSNVMSELEYLRDRYHFRSLMIHDDSMTQDPDWVEQFCEEYQRRGFRQPFWAQSRADFVCEHPRIIASMARAGLAGLSIGFESGNDRILRMLRKGVTVQQNYDAARICRKHGIRIFANYMLGLPTESKDEVMDTVRMIREIRPDHHSCSFFTPLPGSDLAEYCVENDLCLARTHSEYNRGRLTPKIRGIDYDFLLRAVDEARDAGALRRILKRLQRTSVGREAIKRLSRFYPSRVFLTALMRFMRRRTVR
jgi:anaerobic magnesium-protoporphyrin IX monomethyl ester cyclase